MPWMRRLLLAADCYLMLKIDAANTKTTTAAKSIHVRCVFFLRCTYTFIFFVISIELCILALFSPGRNLRHFPAHYIIVCTYWIGIFFNRAQMGYTNNNMEKRYIYGWWKKKRTICWCINLLCANNSNSSTKMLSENEKLDTYAWAISANLLLYVSSLGKAQI